MSSGPPRTWHDYLEDMIQLAEDCLRLSDGLDMESIESSLALNYGLRYAIGMLGEAANNIPPDVRAENPDIPWRGLVDMRNVLVHFYHGIDLDLLWDVIDNEIPTLLTQLKAMQEKYQ